MTVVDDVPQPDEDRDAERAVLASMLAFKDAIADALSGVNGEDFLADEAHQALFEDILDLYGADTAVSVEAVLKLRAERGAEVPDAVAQYLRELADAAPAALDQLPGLLQHVHGRAVLTRLGQAAQLVGKASKSAPQDAEAALEYAALAVTRARGRGLLLESNHLSDIMESALDRIEGASQHKVAGIPTGFNDLDRLTTGLHAGQLVVVAGRPALGKTTFGMDLLRCCAIKNGLPGALFTGQSTSDEMAMRVLAAECRVALHFLRSGRMSDDDWGRLARRMGEVSAAPLFINARARMTLSDIEAECRELRHHHDLRLAVVDTVNLVRCDRRSDTRYLEVSEVAVALKQLARELGITIVVTAELNRGVEQRPDKVPVISDLRDSGLLEEVADLVILLYRPDAYDYPQRASEADLIVAKHREGPTATITVAHQPYYSRFVDMPPPATTTAAAQGSAGAELPTQADGAEDQPEQVSSQE